MPGKPDVQDRHVRPLRDGRGQALDAIVTKRNVQIRRAQAHLDQSLNHLGVLYHQDTLGFHRSSLVFPKTVEGGALNEGIGRAARSLEPCGQAAEAADRRRSEPPDGSATCSTKVSS